MQQFISFGFVVIVISAVVAWIFQASQAQQSKQQPVGGRDLTEEEDLIVLRYNKLYREVPMWGGQEWKSLSTDELISIHQDAARLLALYHDVSMDVVVQEMVDRAEELSRWMTTNQSRGFYAGSDMRAFINGPRAVAEALKAM